MKTNQIEPGQKWWMKSNDVVVTVVRAEGIPKDGTVIIKFPTSNNYAYYPVSGTTDEYAFEMISFYDGTFVKVGNVKREKQTSGVSSYNFSYKDMYTGDVFVDYDDKKMRAHLYRYGTKSYSKIKCGDNDNFDEKFGLKVLKRKCAVKTLMKIRKKLYVELEKINEEIKRENEEYINFMKEKYPEMTFNPILNYDTRICNIRPSF